MTVRFTAHTPAGREVLLAEGVLGETVIRADGNFYADPSVVKTDVLKRTENTYTCPYKGLCYYYSMIDSEGNAVLDQVTWVYDEPMEGWDQIAGKFGFYSHDMNGVTVSQTED
ncbi:MAG: hypothetical protein TR69_WS6001000981 [candidate division WS6 bacterium OLB20]|uniref:DUF427 domain-containing protein n=1 Tax=candidate division WS6 bacterium OLB20 TaxID=1617426 RepID=A0A136LZ83_9BACT|nr:MAG: hypothetical protein TR69_WS6001000981 [candidate division WS6 bacterium OLB20]